MNWKFWEYEDEHGHDDDKQSPAEDRLDAAVKQAEEQIVNGATMRWRARHVSDPLVEAMFPQQKRRGS